MKNKRALNLLLIANAVSGFAQGISIISIPWYYTDVLDKNFEFGITYALITFFSLFWGLYSGTLIDKYSRKNIFLAVNLTGGIVLGTVAFAGWQVGEVPEWGIGLVFAVTIFIFNIHYPALYAFAHEITEKENYAKANSLLEIQVQATTMIAGAMAAVLLAGTKNQTANIFGFVVHLPADVERWNMYMVFALDAATYFISSLFIVFIRYQPSVKKIIDAGTVMERINTGIRFLKEHKLIFLFGNASYAIFVVLLVEANQLMPRYVDKHLNEDASVYASAEMYYALGALLAGFTITKIFKSMHSVRSIIIMMIITAAGCFVCAVTKSVMVFYVFSFLIGITNAGTRILRVTYLFHHVPNSVIGRVSSVFNVFNVVFRTFLIALFSLPFFIASNNVIHTYTLCGIFILFWTIPMLIRYKKLIEYK